MVAHHYRVDSEQSRISDPVKATNALRATPTPGPNQQTASASGARNNVGSLVLGDGGANYVRSFRIASPDPKKYTDIVVNYTIHGEHVMDEGFVMRYGQIENGRVKRIVTYGEGNALLQDPTFQFIWQPIVNRTWNSLNLRLGF